jgi:signal transduction histidine kinase
VSWGNSHPADRILMYLAEIGAGRCSITDETIVDESDPDMSQILVGLLVLYEDLAHASRLQTEAETGLRRALEERERLLEDRRQAVAARDQFLAVAAHELRTPLTTLGLLVDHLNTSASAELRGDAKTETVPRQQLAMLKRQVDRLRGLVAEMLDVSRITRGNLQLEPGRVDLREVVREVLDRFALEIERHQVMVSVDAPTPVHGTWDAARVDQVVTNLVSNALKYGAGRPIEVSVRAGTSWATIVVRDHGVGIPLEEQTTVFGPFARAVAARHHSGLGLGLWIAQQIVHASGGRISLESQPGEGSTFTVELPL